MSNDIFDIPSSVIQQAEQARSFKLAVPENARRHRREPGTFFWMESGTITSANSASYSNEKTNQRVTALSFEVEINGEGSGLNPNKPLSTTFRINNEALKTGEPKTQLTMSLMSIAKMKALFHAVGIEGDLAGGGFSKALLNTYFPPSEDTFPSETSPFVGHTIYFEVKQGPRELPDGSLKETPEINKILAEGGK